MRQTRRWGCSFSSFNFRFLVAHELSQRGVDPAAVAPEEAASTRLPPGRFQDPVHPERVTTRAACCRLPGGG